MTGLLQLQIQLWILKTQSDCWTIFLNIVHKCHILFIDSSFFFQITKRNVQNLEVFNLEQIQLLSERCLVNFFSDLTSNEITRNFIFTCALMPDKCQVQYKSFGNETQARLRMKKHLNAHIQDLLKEQNGEYMHNIY